MHFLKNSKIDNRGELMTCWLWFGRKIHGKKKRFAGACWVERSRLCKAANRQSLHRSTQNKVKLDLFASKTPNPQSFAKDH
jgi:hypothetical protein